MSEEDKIDYLEALYANYRIRIGDGIIKYNREAAQGSILSPALFDIYIEDLVDKVTRKVGLSFEDILLYADDILIICQTQSQISLY